MGLTATLAAADQGEAVEVGLPTREQATLVSPTSPACIAQDELEPMLEGTAFVGERPARARSGARRAERAEDGGHVLTLGGPGERRRRVRAST